MMYFLVVVSFIIVIVVDIIQGCKLVTFHRFKFKIGHYCDSSISDEF